MSNTLPINVSIISNDLQDDLSAGEVSQLGKAMRHIREVYPGQVILHHGCNPESSSTDARAHRFALDYAWQIEGYPAYKVIGVEPRLSATVKRQLDILHPAQRLSVRDASLVWAAEIIVAIRPRLSQTKALLAEVPAIGWKVITISGPVAKRPAVPDKLDSNAYSALRHTDSHIRKTPSTSSKAEHEPPARSQADIWRESPA